jgi:hypothetical protein
MIRGKSCYGCGRWYPLFMFKKDSRKFQLPIALGKVRNCRVCVWKDSANGNKVVRWRDGKFFVIELKLKERLKELFSK